MFNDTSPHTLYKRRRPLEARLSYLLELYEHNYRLLHLLCGRHFVAPQSTVMLSYVPGCRDLYWSVGNRSRFTTTMHLSYRIAGANEVLQLPDFTVTVYHDARLAEVASGLVHGLRHEPRRQRDLQESWRVNRYLFKWLGLCLRQGHHFDRTSMETTKVG